MTHDFHPGAGEEYREAAAWYEEQSSGLGTAFVAAVDAAILIIYRDPGRFQIVGEGVRVFRLKRFPYYLYSGFDSVRGHLRFYGVVHYRKRPDYGALERKPSDRTRRAHSLPARSGRTMRAHR